MADDSLFFFNRIGPIILLAIVGTGTTALRRVKEQRSEEVAAHQRELYQTKAREEMLLDAYSDRTSLAALQHAVEVYEQHR